MKISENTFVTLQYKLHVKNEQGELEMMEETTPEKPLEFFFGLGMMLPKFEEHLAGKATDDTFEFVLSPEEAYGQFDPEAIIDLDRSVFEVEGKIDESRIYVGAIVPLMDNQNNRINAEIKAISDDKIKIDLNHPLVGETLYFSGKINAVRVPTDEELAGMQHQGGCDSCSGCGDGGCSDGGCSDGGCC